MIQRGCILYSDERDQRAPDVIEREAQSTLDSLEIRKHGRVVWTLAVMLSGVGTQHAFAQGGPPLVGDDPETRDPVTWEIDLAVTTSHGPGETDWALPDADINYGWAIAFN